MPISSQSFWKKSLSLAAALPLLASIGTPLSVVGKESSDAEFGSAVSAAAAAAKPGKKNSKTSIQSTQASPSRVQQDDRIRHLLNRITFGPTSDDIDHVKQVGIDRYIDEQLNSQKIPEPQSIVRLVSNAPALTQSPAHLFMNYARPVLVALNKQGRVGPNGQIAANEQVDPGREKMASGDGNEQMDSDRDMSMSDQENGKLKRWRNRGAFGSNAVKQNAQDNSTGNQTGAFRPGRLARGNGGFGRFNTDNGGSPQSDRSLDRQPTNDRQPGNNQQFNGQQQSGAQGQDGNQLDKKALQQMIGEGYRQLYGQVTDARVKRDVYSPRQLEEVMTDFWFNHFNVSIDKGLDHIWVGSYEEEAIRPYAFGHFRDLLGATAHHAAMMFYLDNSQNSRSRDAQLAQGQKRGRLSGLNENYARELMELHTLGVDGGYTQRDVTELARILTGHGIINQRSVQRDPEQMEDKFGFWFDRNRHDFADKILLGHKIKGRGDEEVEEALDILASHPSTAKHISYQLAQYFVADDPPAALVDKMASTFTSTDGDIKEVLRTMFKSKDFWDPKYYSGKFKSPYRYLISSLRASGAYIQNTQPLLGFLNQQGMPLYRCLTPDGYKNTQTAWLNSSTLVQRINFATALGSGRHPSATVADMTPENLMGVVGIKPGSDTEAAVLSAPKQLKLSLLIGSPEFMRY